MPVLVPIEDVKNPRFLSVSGGLETTVINAAGNLETSHVTMEVYTGVVIANFSNTGLNINTRRDEVKSFVPFEFMKVKAYPQDSIIDFTAKASLASFAGTEDEAVLVGVDNVSNSMLPLESQPFGECLVMPVLLAALNANIYRYTYQLTLLVREVASDEIVELSPLNTGTTPA